MQKFAFSSVGDQRIISEQRIKADDNVDRSCVARVSVQELEELLAKKAEVLPWFVLGS